jgi:Tfp pilus assembly protein PilO
MKTEIIVEAYTKYKLIIFPILVGAVAILVAFFIIYPQITKYFEGREQVKRLEDRIKRLNEKVEALASLDTSDFNKKVNISLQALPNDKDLANLIGLIQSLAEQNGVILVALALGQGASDGQFNPFTVRLEVGGTREGFKNFINNLEKAPRVMKVVSLELSPARASDSASANTIIELYFAPTPSEIGAKDAPLPVLTAEEEQLISDLEKANPAPVFSGETAPAPNLPKGKTNPFQ